MWRVMPTYYVGLCVSYAPSAAKALLGTVPTGDLAERSSLSLCAVLNRDAAMCETIKIIGCVLLMCLVFVAMMAMLIKWSGHDR